MTDDNEGTEVPAIMPGGGEVVSADVFVSAADVAAGVTIEEAKTGDVDAAAGEAALVELAAAGGVVIVTRNCPLPDS
jgi:hypothetical protein